MSLILLRRTMPHASPSHTCVQTTCVLVCMQGWLRCCTQAKDLMGQCFQAGVNYFDNAEVYAEGAQVATPPPARPPCSCACCEHTPPHGPCLPDEAACLTGNSEIVMGEAIKVRRHLTATGTA